MGRRKGGSSAGTAILVVLGVGFAAISAAYQFVVENLGAIKVICAVGGTLLLLAHFSSKFGKRKEQAVEPGTVRAESVLTGGISSERMAIATRARSCTFPETTPGQALARWVDQSEKVAVQGAVLTGGMFYLGSRLLVDGEEVEAYAINPELAARSSIPDVTGASMPYWPSYEDISPAARRAFLEWMAGGRADPSYGIGHVFIFFYGLEHRVFVERDRANAPAVVAEVQRLISIYGLNESFAGYAKHFLDMAACFLGTPLPVPVISPERNYSPEIGLAVRIHIGKRLAQSNILLSEDALIWALSLHDVYLRTPAVRCFDEFVSLWHIRFRERLPDGLKISTSGNVDLTYSAASGSFDAVVVGPFQALPDMTKVTTSLEPIRQLVQDCTDELDGFSRLVGRKPEARNAAHAALLLPKDLTVKHGFEPLDIFTRKLAELMGGQNRASTKMRNLLELAGFEPDDAGKVSPSIADQVGQLLDRVDVAVEPDRRYGGSVPQLDDQVFLFGAEGGGAVDPEHPAYRAMKAQVEVAVLAAAADGEASSDEMQRVIVSIRDGADLTGVERARLIAFAVIVFNSPPKQARVLKRLSERSEIEREAIANAAIAVIAAGETVQPDEVKFLERLHKALSLPQDRVYSGLHRNVTPADEPIAVSVEHRENGIPIPKEAIATPVAPIIGVRINAERLARTQRETAAVSELLANIFEEETSPTPVENPIDADAGKSALQGLDHAHAELVELLEIRGSISRSEFEDRARAIKLLPEGALERINDWSFDQFEEPLLEEGDEVSIVPHLRGRLAELRETMP